MVIFQFTEVRDTLTPYGIAGLPYEAEVISGDPHGIAFDHGLKGIDVNGKVFGKFFQAGYTFPERFLPLLHHPYSNIKRKEKVRGRVDMS